MDGGRILLDRSVLVVILGSGFPVLLLATVFVSVVTVAGLLPVIGRDVSVVAVGGTTSDVGFGLVVVVVTARCCSVVLTGAIDLVVVSGGGSV